MKLRRIVIVLGIMALLVWFLSPGSMPVQEGSILVVDLEGPYVEAVEPSLLSRVVGDRRRNLVSLLSELRKAERDDRLAAVILRIRGLEIGWGKAQEIRDAISSLSAAGRRTVAYLELASFGASLDYFVASAADEVQLAPGTRAPLIGLAAEYLFLGGLWEKFGIDLEVERIGKYKTFADTLAGEKMSDAHREMATSLLDSLYEVLVGGIAQGRGLTREFVRDAIDHAPVTPEEMVKLGLADGVHFFDQVIDDLGAGAVIEAEEYAAVDAADVGFDPVAQFALVYGSGAVVMGEGTTSPTGGPILAAETVSDALADAAADPSISAIIFRIDSPGGSALASDVVWQATQRAQRSGTPVVVSFSDVAASGGYYVAAGADAIVASPGSITGSIGVVVVRPVLRGLLDKLGIGVESMTRGAHADLLIGSRPLSPGSREWLRTEVESVYDLFVARVAAGRRLSPERVNEIGRGRVYTGAEAVKLGLIDGLGGLREAVLRAKAVVGIEPEDDVALVPFPAQRSLSDQLSDAMRRMSVVASPPLPRIVRRIEEILLALPVGAPALVPPVVFDIR
jgi:protease-4